jgi:hypothetical protein
LSSNPQKWVDGEGLVNQTPEEIEALENSSAPQPPPLARQQIAAVRLDIADWNVDISRSQGLAAAMMADETTAWVFFEEEQPDTTYIVTPGEGVTKLTDHIEIDTGGAQTVLRIVERIQ